MSYSLGNKYKNDLLNDLIFYGGLLKLFEAYPSLTASEQGVLAECTWDLVHKLGYMVDNAIHFEGKPGKHGTLTPVTNIKAWLNQKVSNGNTTGCADITYQKEDTFYFASCKFHKEAKNVQHYGIEQIISMIHANPEFYPKYEIILLVNNKEDVWKKFRNARSPDITSYIANRNIYDINDLEKILSIMTPNIVPVQTEMTELILTAGFLHNGLQKSRHNMIKEAIRMLDESRKHMFFEKSAIELSIVGFITKYPRLMFLDLSVDELICKREMIENIFKQLNGLETSYRSAINRNFIWIAMMMDDIPNTSENKQKLDLVFPTPKLFGFWKNPEIPESDDEDEESEPEKDEVIEIIKPNTQWFKPTHTLNKLLWIEPVEESDDEVIEIIHKSGWITKFK
jgi:hypothetical protein